MTLRVCLRRKNRAPARPRRALVAKVCALESRSLATVSGLTVEAALTFLHHPNPQNQPPFVQNTEFAPVTIAGMVNTDQATPPVIQFRVIDQYGLSQRSGTIAAQVPPFAAGNGLETYLFSTRIGLPLRHRPNGRQFLIVVTASDANNTETATTSVFVEQRQPVHGPK